MSIRVVNAKVYRGPGVYVGRASSLARARKLCGGELLDYSILGNNAGTVARDGRAKAIAEYKAWLWKQMQARGLVSGALVRLAKMARSGDLVLVCWCAPQACHGHAVMAAIDWLLSQ